MSAVDDDLLDERRDEGALLGQFAVLQEPAQILGERGDSVDVAQNSPAIRQRRLGFALGVQQPLLAASKLSYAWREVRHFEVGILDGGVQPSQPPARLLDPESDRLQLFAMLPGSAVHLLFDQLREVPDVSLGQHVAPHLVDDETLELSGVEPGRAASRSAAIELRLADVVREPPALGALTGEGATAACAFDQSAQQVCAGGAPRMDLRRGTGTHKVTDAPELRLRHESWEGVFNSHRFRLGFGGRAPDQRAGVGDVC